MTITSSAALDYSSRGWSVFPVHGKRPLVQWKAFSEVPPSPESVRIMWEEHPDAGIALALGQVSGVVRVDADGDEATVKFLEMCGCAPDTLEFKTPSGGRGWLFKYNQAVDTEVLWKGDGKHREVRVQSNGAYTVVPPSPGYEWTNDVPIVDLPRKLLGTMLSIKAGKVLAEAEANLPPTLISPERPIILEALKALDPCRADDRDNWLQVGMALHTAGAEYLTPWIEWSATSDKFKPGECEQLWSGFKTDGKLTVRSLLFWAKEDGWEPPDVHEPLTDVGNGRVLARACQGRAFFCREWDKWLFWNGKKMVRDGEFEVIEEAKRLARERYVRATRSLVKLCDYDGSDKKQKLEGIAKVLSWCKASESAGRVHAAVDMAKTQPEIHVPLSSLGREPWLLNCTNGTVDLRSGDLREHRATDFLTQLCPTEFSADAVCPRWYKFLDEVFRGDSNVISWLQKLLGYTLTGVVTEHVLPIFYGSGRNGKSTLIKTIIHVMGEDYAGTTPSGFLSVSTFEQHPTKIAGLFGKRFVADLETKDGAKLDEELVKRLTGGDELQARKMFEDFWSFQPTHKLILATNYEPKVRGTDIAIWSRLKLVPFNAVFEGDKCDKNIDDKLRAESSGILKWLVDGCFRWQSEGLGGAEVIVKATESYRRDQDSVETFWGERVEAAPGIKLRKSDVASAYKQYCYGVGVEPVGVKTFAAAVVRLGVASDDSGKFYLGVKLT